MTETPINLGKSDDAKVYVGKMYAKTEEFPFDGETSINGYLKQAGITVARGEIVTVNSVTVDGKNLDKAPERNAVIVVATGISNG